MHIIVKVVATDSAVAALSVAIVVTLMCTSLSQHCHYQCCHNALLVFAATALCLFSLPQHCAHRCLTTLGFSCVDKHTDRQTDRWTNTQTDRHVDKQMNRETAKQTEKTSTALWQRKQAQRRDSSGSDSAETMMCTLVSCHYFHSDVHIAVTLVRTSLSQCCQLTALPVSPLSQCCQCHCCHTSVHSNVTVLSLSSLLHRTSLSY